MTRNGAAAMKAVVWASSPGISFVTTRGSGSPNNSRNCADEEIVCWPASIIPPV
jgi:hypothetical protein